MLNNTKKGEKIMKKSVFAAFTAIVAAASLAACGASSTPSATTAAATTAAATKAATEAATNATTAAATEAAAETSVAASGNFRTLDEIKQSGTVKIGVFSDKAPFGYVDDKGEYQGYDVYYAHRIADDREVDLAGEQRLIEVRASLRTKADVHLRVLVNEGFQYVCELEAGIIGGHTDLQRAGEFTLRIRREAADLRQILLNRPHVWEDRLGDRRQDHALFRADKQLTAKLLLDGLDPLRERRLCREQALGGFRDVVGFR